jgi:hypothetical protein
MNIEQCHVYLGLGPKYIVLGPKYIVMCTKFAGLGAWAGGAGGVEDRGRRTRYQHQKCTRTIFGI